MPCHVFLATSSNCLLYKQTLPFWQRSIHCHVISKQLDKPLRPSSRNTSGGRASCREHLISCTPLMEDEHGLTKRLLPRWNWASGGRAATALPACCSPAAPAMLRWGYDGVTMGLRRSYEGIQGNTAA